MNRPHNTLASQSGQAPSNEVPNADNLEETSNPILPEAFTDVRADDSGPRVEVGARQIGWEEKQADNDAIIKAFLDSFVAKNASPATTLWHGWHANGWLKGIDVADATHPNGKRQLFIWEAMEPIHGHEHFITIRDGLVKADVKGTSMVKYFGEMRRQIEAVLKQPFIPTPDGHRGDSICEKYGPLVMPFDWFDYPKHELDTDAKAFALTGDALNDFYDFVRLEYIPKHKYQLRAARDYTMTVVAGTTGFRKIEVNTLSETCDFFCELDRIQTRFGKASRGSGPRIRLSIYPLFAQKTVECYMHDARPFFPSAKTCDELFLSSISGPFPYNSAHSRIKQIADAARKAGIFLPPCFGWHSLRRSFATNFIDTYPDLIFVLMKLMGHKDLRPMGKYIVHPPAWHEAKVDEFVSANFPRSLSL